MINTPMKQLLKEKSDPCISIFVSMGVKSFSDLEKLHIKLKNAQEEVKKDLSRKYEASISKPLVQKIETLAEGVKAHHRMQGLGLFVSANHSTVIYFPFPVKGRVVVDDTFEVRDIVANMNWLIPYHVLLLSKGESRLFKGIGVELTEVAGTDFPQKYEEEFQVQRSSPGQFYTSEESKINQSRLEDFFRKIDRALDTHLHQSPLIVIGVDKYLSTFTSISKHTSQIIGTAKGNYDKQGTDKIMEIVWPLISQYLQEEEAKVIENAKQAVYQQKAISGIQEVWEAVQQGLGRQLIVERSYSHKAYMENKYKALIMEGDGELGYNEIPDAVEVIIQTLANQHDTQIQMVDDGALKDYGQIILLTRY